VKVPEIGDVHGSVLQNGQPAAGLQVALRRETNNGNANNGENGWGNMRFGNFGREWNATVDERGQFTLRNVASGSYQLSISSSRRGNALHTETVVVSTGGTAEVAISLTTASLQGELTVDDDTPRASLGGTILLIPGATTVPEDLAEARRNSSVFTARVQEGRFRFDVLPPGAYLAVLTSPGRVRSSAQVFVAAGQSNQLSIAVGAKSN